MGIPAPGTAPRPGTPGGPAPGSHSRPSGPQKQGDPQPHLNNSSNGTSVSNAQKTGIDGALRAFNVAPTGNKSNDMKTFLSQVNDSAKSGSISETQGNRLNALFDLFNIDKTGDKNSDLTSLASKFTSFA